MKNRKRALGAAVALAALLGIPALGSAQENAQQGGQQATQPGINYSPVTQQRLENPEPGNWLLYRRTYNGHGFSPLNQINVNNVRGLTPAWTFATGVIEGHEAPPMVNNGVMFVTTPENQVIAMNAVNGDLLWRYKPKMPEDLFQLHPTNRGVAMWEDKLFLARTDSMLDALDARTGKVLWSKKTGDYKVGYYMTLEPLVVDGVVMVGVSGGEFGVRGYIAGYDAKDGHELWKTYTIPAPGEPGSNTWQGDDWKHGGGSVWITGTYDPQHKIAYWGVGNAAPWPGEAHPGDNLYTSSTIGLDPHTGKIMTHHQYHWNDSWDWDEVDAPMLFPHLRVGNRDVANAIVHPGRDGYLWVLEQGPEGINFVAGQPFVEQDAFKSIDPRTGRPTYVDSHKPNLRGDTNFCPSLWGGKDWPSASFADSTGLLVVPANNNMCGSMKGAKMPYTPGQVWVDTDVNNLPLRPHGDHLGELQAWDLTSGKQVWKHNFPNQLFASVLTTGGDLTFVGGTPDRYFRAFDTRNGNLLWQIKTNSGIMGMPTAFAVNGKEYIAIQSGWGVDAQRINDSLTKAGWKTAIDDTPQGGVVWVFSLNEPAGPGGGQPGGGPNR